MDLLHGSALAGVAEASPNPEAPRPPARPRARHVVGAIIRQIRAFELAARWIFGITVLVASLDKFAPGAAGTYVAQIPGPSAGPWFAFWSSIAEQDPGLFTHTVAGLELGLAVGLLLGLLRKPLYLMGIGLGVFLWTVPEGFSRSTYTGGLGASAGLLYLTGLLLLIALETTFGPDPLTLDVYLVRRWPRWALLSSFLGTTAPIEPPAYMLAMTPFLSEEGGTAAPGTGSPGPPTRRRRG